MPRLEREGLSVRHFQQAVDLVYGFAQQGLMLELHMDQVMEMHGKGRLVLATDDDGNVVGVAGLPFQYPDGKFEFGGWAVAPEYQGAGIGLGLQLLRETLNIVPEGSRVVAFGNSRSAEIFLRLGGVELDHREMHPSAFELCNSCHCDKRGLRAGQLCIDRIIDITNVREVLNRSL